MIDLDLFAGPGGWSTAARELGLPEVGIEWDRAACATRAAAGHRTIRADVSRFVITPALAEIVRGLIGSPPCTTFSAAGDQAGNAILELLAALIRDLFAGRDTRQACRGEMEAALTASEWGADLDAPKRAAKIRAAVFSASLVAEPARYIAACRPEWVALEQVPAVLPLWQVYVAELRRMGYSAWTGRVNAADYGTPQTRTRAVLVASRAHRVSCPAPTHRDPRKAAGLWEAPWVSMRDALGWGATGRPAPTVTAGGTSTGGAEPFGHRDRQMLEAERDAGRWVFRNNNNAKACVRGLDQPAGTIFFGRRANWAAWVLEGADGRALESVRITVEEAAVLQSFPADYPWRGTKTARFTQVGNAVPPRLAAHVLSMATGIPLELTSAA